MSRMFSTGSFHEITKNGPRPKGMGAGPGESAGPTSEKTAKWPGASGPTRKSGYNRKTNWHEVKIRAVKAGIE